MTIAKDLEKEADVQEMLNRVVFVSCDEIDCTDCQLNDTELCPESENYVGVKNENNVE